MQLYPKTQAALKLHDAGYWVVPCDGKKPIANDWPNTRVERDDLRETLQDNPNLNIGIVLNRSNIIDIEYDHGPEKGEAALRDLFGGDIPKTPMFRSPRGRHRLFRRPDGLPEKAKIEISGIECRIGNGKGALSILPPSEGRHWFGGLSLGKIAPAELSQQVVERLRSPAPKPQPREDSDGDTIPEGKRNDTLFQKAIALKSIGLAEEAIANALLDVNARHCKPPLDETEVRNIAKSAANGEAKPSLGFIGRLLQDIELWHDDNDEPYATLPQGGHNENWRIGKKVRQFRRWLSKMFYDATGEMIGSDALGNLAALLEGKAVFDGEKFKVWVRVGEHEGKIYIDLCDPAWRAIEVDTDGWRIVPEPPNKFRRAKAMQALPDPIEAPGSDLYDLLAPFLNIGIEQWPLVAAWLAAALRPRGPYPLLKFLGEQGSSKTTQARILRALVDPNGAPVRAEPRDTRDLMIASNNGWVIALDNLSVIKQQLSDALCRLATGGGFATRTLYTDEDETIFDAMRPVIVTSIEDIGTREDLLERSLLIHLPTIPANKRKAEKNFWAEFEEARPKILGALLNVVAGALRRLPQIESRTDTELSRMADFEQWGEAAEESLGLAPGSFREAYTANREAAVHIALESNPFVAALLQHVKKHPQIEATATQLLAEVGRYDPELRRQPGWPKTPRVLSATLRRVAPNLRQVAITAVQGTRGTGNNKEKIWRIAGPSDPAPRVETGTERLKRQFRERGSQSTQG